MHENILNETENSIKALHKKLLQDMKTRLTTQDKNYEVEAAKKGGPTPKSLKPVKILEKELSDPEAFLEGQAEAERKILIQTLYKAVQFSAKNAQSAIATDKSKKGQPS